MWNRLKTFMLLALLSGLLLAFGSLFGGKAGLNVALIMALIMNFITFFFSDKIVLSLYGAQPLDTTHYAWIYTLVQELSATMQLPMPKLWLIKTPMANAFATGRSPSHASVAVTTGILEILDEHELRGVLAHELSHIKNHDVLVATVAATIATAIGYLANMIQHMAFWESIRGNSDRKNNNIFGLIIASVLMPLAAMLVQMAISRSREYLADETGAYCSRDPLALASALEKLHRHIPEAHLRNDDTARASTASLFIVHPFTSNALLSLFSTHPPVGKRIERLQKIREKMLFGR